MAVTFKVPKSPKRSIEGIDTFLGVDMTNTGVSMENYRSPNAPNMIRNVPGKVRKRMGYYKEVYFGTPVNVNLAWGTSAQEKEILIDSSNVTDCIKIYDLIQEVVYEEGVQEYIFLEFDYKSDNDFYIMDIEGSGGGTRLVRASEDWTHASITMNIEEAEGPIKIVEVLSLYLQSIYIKNFALMRERDSNYKWSPAPKHFVKRDSDDPVYGCHVLKNGTNGYDGDRTVNVNRALKTHSTWEEFTFTERFAFLYRLAEIPCPDQTIYIDFDYGYTADDDEPAEMDVGFAGDGILLQQTGSGTTHISESFKLQDIQSSQFVDHVRVSISNNTTNAHFKIKNFSLCYEKDENYTWSPAPEDNDEKFYLIDMYNVVPKNYAVAESYSKETISFNGIHEETFDLTTYDDHGGDYQRISFDITTSIANSEVTFNGAGVSLIDNTGVAYAGYDNYKIANGDYPFYDPTKNFKKTHIEHYAYCGDNKYINRIRVSINVSGGSTKANILISNITVKSYTIRDDFAVSSKWFLYHVGKQFYLRAHDSDKFTSVYEDANESMSRSWQLNNNSYIVDGKNIYEFSIKEGERVQPIDEELAYIPIVTDAKEPDGGGTARDPLNLLQPGFYEQFIGRAGVTEYQLSFDGLDEKECKAWVLDSNSNWNIKEENTDFTVDRETGKIKFNTAPGETPIQGEPSVKILAYRTVEGYRSRITKCRFGVLFGVAGACDRIFLAGNPEHPNWDFYSGYRDGTYYPDTGYSTLGSEQSAITGYAIVSNYLATFKDGFDASQSVFIREGDMLEDEETGASDPVFKLINSLQGEGAIAPFSFGYLETEPLFLTKAGVYAITEQDITGEKYSQNRSFYLDGKLRKEPNLKDAIATIYDNQYVLALNNQLYILDGLQATRTDKSEPYATRQYAGFYCTDIPATCLWTDDQICFGTSDGRICRFYSDEEALESYNDDGKPIYACWETPDLDGSLFYKNKTFRYLAVRLMKSIKTTSRLYSRKLGVWNFIREEKVIQNPIDFGNFDFELLTFSVDDTEKVLHSKVRVKKVDKARFRIENDTINEPFGLFDLALEYIESGNYKG